MIFGPDFDIAVFATVCLVFAPIVLAVGIGALIVSLLK
jgi:hypothetical protein